MPCQSADSVLDSISFDHHMNIDESTPIDRMRGAGQNQPFQTQKVVTSRLKNKPHRVTPSDDRAIAYLSTATKRTHHHLSPTCSQLQHYPQGTRRLLQCLLTEPEQPSGRERTHILILPQDTALPSSRSRPGRWATECGRRWRQSKGTEVAARGEPQNQMLLWRRFSACPPKEDVSGDFLPRLYVHVLRTRLYVSLDCDPLSEKLKRSRRGLGVAKIYDHRSRLTPRISREAASSSQAPEQSFRQARVPREHVNLKYLLHVQPSRYPAVSTSLSFTTMI
ncbi:hypothetical protein K461DRAFT_177959 [Myriangium duriaei CBS 260.36]|uniref:Uncharacterized protein n=1 Tax=Myriangium duriaei CBS 260.36 TaxID=1168546 RepID=A0A9P4MEV8_9PEZI|nr:hypothetical protein K461DRAFT_177959 [Myriangium duriaei CBS 260.36]